MLNSLLLLSTLVAASLAAPRTVACDTVQKGYQCSPELSHFWGQYSPYFSVPSEISPAIPKQCTVTFGQVLSRHGARDPTASKTATYQLLVARIKSYVKSFSGKYAFLNDYEYTLGADQLTVFGQQEMVNSGVKFYQRYGELARRLPTFFRAAGEYRVVESGLNFTQGYHNAREQDRQAQDVNQTFPYSVFTIPEEKGINNTLNHGLCPAFEDGKYAKVGDEAQAKYLTTLTPLRERLNSDLQGANLTIQEVIYFMDLCPFETVANDNGVISPFCALFSDDEWRQYDYYNTVGKWYGYGPGNPLGPTQGVGFVNELIARLTGKPVEDHTSTNTSLTSDPAAFPIGGKHALFADFSHDNDMTAVLGALGLYNTTQPLSTARRQSPAQTDGFAASWVAPFASRIYVEKMTCRDNAHGYADDTEFVRVLVNDRVAPLRQCGGDSLGRCELTKFVESLAFARGGGLWDECFRK